MTQLRTLNLKSVLETLEHNSELAIAWFEMNYMKLNTDKCYLLISGNKNGQIWAELDRDIVWESNDVKLIGIKINNNNNNNNFNNNNNNNNN